MGPTYIAWSPSASSTVLYLSNTVRSPPTHSASLRVRAPLGPPLTGASSRCTPRAANCSCSRSEEHTSELQSHSDLVCRLLLEKKNHTSASTWPHRNDRAAF